MYEYLTRAGTPASTRTGMEYKYNYVRRGVGTRWWCRHRTWPATAAPDACHRDGSQTIRKHSIDTYLELVRGDST